MCEPSVEAGVKSSTELTLEQLVDQFVELASNGWGAFEAGGGSPLLKLEIDKQLTIMTCRHQRLVCSIKLINSSSSGSPLVEDVQWLLDKLFDRVTLTVNVVIRQFDAADSFYSACRVLKQLSTFEEGSLPRNDKSGLYTYLFTKGVFPEFKLKAILHCFTNLPLFYIPPTTVYRQVLKLGKEEWIIEYLRSCLPTVPRGQFRSQLTKVSMHYRRSSVYNELCRVVGDDCEKKVMDTVPFSFSINSRILYRLLREGSVSANRYLKSMTDELDRHHLEGIEYDDAMARCLFELAAIADIESTHRKVVPENLTKIIQWTEINVKKGRAAPCPLLLSSWKVDSTSSGVC